jgi:hypothetical protein
MHKKSYNENQCWNEILLLLKNDERTFMNKQHG